MGYRSEVKIVAGKNPAIALRDVIKKFDNICQLSEAGTNERGDTLFSADWAKWYEDDDDEFPDVAAVMKVVKKFAYELTSDAHTPENGIEYARVGEDDSDTEYISNGCGYGYLSIGVKCSGEDKFKDTTKQLEAVQTALKLDKELNS